MPITIPDTAASFGSGKIWKIVAVLALLLSSALFATSQLNARRADTSDSRSSPMRQRNHSHTPRHQKQRRSSLGGKREFAQSELGCGDNTLKCLLHRTSTTTRCGSTARVCAESVLRRFGVFASTDWWEKSGIPQGSPRRKRGGAKSANRALVIGCGNCGTHSLVAMLKESGIKAKHENYDEDITIGWFFASPTHWVRVPQSPWGPVIKLHRHPLHAIASMAHGFSDIGHCINSNIGCVHDILSWTYAKSQLPDLPLAPSCVVDPLFNGLNEPITVKSAETHCKTLPANRCCGTQSARLHMAMHYYVYWNLLSDKWADISFQVENVDSREFLQRWRTKCEKDNLCDFPARGREFLESNATSPKPTPRPYHYKKKKDADVSWLRLYEMEPRMTIILARLAKLYGYNITDEVVG